MKRTTRILSLALALLLLTGMALTLASCQAKLSGEYEYKLGTASVILKFSGDKVTFSGDVDLLKASFSIESDTEIEYKILDTDDDKQKIQFFVQDGKDPVELPFSQNKDEKTITITFLLIPITFTKK